MRAIAERRPRLAAPPMGPAQARQKETMEASPKTGPRAVLQRDHERQELWLESTLLDLEGRAIGAIEQISKQGLRARAPKGAIRPGQELLGWAQSHEMSEKGARIEAIKAVAVWVSEDPARPGFEKVGARVARLG